MGKFIRVFNFYVEYFLFNFHGIVIPVIILFGRNIWIRGSYGPPAATPCYSITVTILLSRQEIFSAFGLVSILHIFLLSLPVMCVHNCMSEHMRGKENFSVFFLLSSFRSKVRPVLYSVLDVGFIMFGCNMLCGSRN